MLFKTCDIVMFSTWHCHVRCMTLSYRACDFLSDFWHCHVLLVSLSCLFVMYHTTLSHLTCDSVKFSAWHCHVRCVTLSYRACDFVSDFWHCRVLVVSLLCLFSWMMNDTVTADMWQCNVWRMTLSHLTCDTVRRDCDTVMSDCDVVSERIHTSSWNCCV